MKDKTSLRQWILDMRDDPESAGKSIQPLLDLTVAVEVSSIKFADHYDYVLLFRKSGIKAMNCLCFVILENGKTVGFNENPAIGWTYPTGRKWKEELPVIPEFQS